MAWNKQATVCFTPDITSGEIQQSTILEHAFYVPWTQINELGINARGCVGCMFRGSSECEQHNCVYGTYIHIAELTKARMR